jgi:hypothetical protein
MAGQAKDLVKRAAVKKFLRAKANRELSDREIARQCGCGRMLVKTVRMELIAAGRHEPIDERTQLGPAPKYKPGAALRGGYVYDESGRPCRESVWRARQARRRS